MSNKNKLDGTSWWHDKDIPMYVFFTVMMALCCAAEIFAQETTVVTEVPGESKDWILWKWLDFILSFEFVWKALLTGGGLLIGWIFKLVIGKFKDKVAIESALRSLEGGVNHAYETIVRDAKKKAKDGKLTLEERASARNLAVAKAKEIAIGEGKSLLLTIGKPVMEAWIAGILAKIKRKKAEKDQVVAVIGK